MTPNEYQQNCLRTESIPEQIFENRMQEESMQMLLQLTQTAGMAADILKKGVFYGKDMSGLRSAMEEAFDEGPDADSDTKPPAQGPLANKKKIRLLHAFLGMLSELAEMAEPLEQYVFEGKDLDDINMMEESGDHFWYHSVWLDALSFDMEEPMRRNIAKLAKRYPGQVFTEDAAINRDHEKERQELEGS